MVYRFTHVSTSQFETKIAVIKTNGAYEGGQQELFLLRVDVNDVQPNYENGHHERSYRSHKRRSLKMVHKVILLILD